MPTVTSLPGAITNYETSDAINQSGLKEIMNHGIQSFLANKDNILRQKDYFESKDHFLIGSAVDVLMSHGTETFNKLYHSSTLEDKPSDTMRTVLHMLLERLSGEPNLFPLDYPDYKVAIHQLLNEVIVKGEKGEVKVGYYMNRAKETWQEDGRMKDIFKPECINYWVDIVTARGKQVLSSNEKNLIETIANSWHSHPHTASAFEENPRIIRLYQIPLYFYINSIYCKGMVDKLDIHLDEMWIDPSDFKTMAGFTLSFPKYAMRGRRYDIQGAFYTEAIKQNLPVLSKMIGVDITNFRLKNFKFIVESTTNPGFPIQFRMDDTLLYKGQRGDERVPGYEQLLEEYAYWGSHGFRIEEAIGKSHEVGTLTVDSEFNYIKP